MIEVEVEYHQTVVETVVEVHSTTVETEVEVFTGRPGPIGPPGIGAPVTEGENMDSLPIVAGMAVAKHSSGAGFIRADRGALATRAVGIASTSANPGFSVQVALGGPVTVLDWTDAAGAPALSNTRLWLGSSGALTPVPPATGLSQLVGEAIGPQILAATIGEPLIKH